MEISSRTPATGYRQDPSVKGAFSASETRMASISERQSLDMNLVTAEGDKVTLSYDAYAAAVYAEHGQVEAWDGDLAVQWGEFSAGQYERELSLTVEGDLNKKEQREIRKAIITIGRMLNKFVEGNINPMMAKSAKLTGLETIASLDLSMAYERQVVTVRETDMTLTYGQHGGGQSRPAASIIGDSLSRPFQPVKSVQAPLIAASEALAKEMAEVVGTIEAPIENVLQVAERLMAKARESLAHKDALAAELFDHIGDRLKALLAAEDSLRAA